MTRQANKFLFDIREAIIAIETFLAGISFEQYVNDLKTKSAVERQLGIIGEAINKFMKETSEVELSHTKEIINLRNRIVHAYDAIDDSIIWAIQTNHLPLLKKEVEKLLET
jgi:uncharacterized protein with HEPN domain